MDVAIHEGRLQRVLRYMEDGFVAARDAERATPAAHTLTEDLLPTTCVVVNKPSALKHFPTTGAAPRPSESRSRVPRNRRMGIPLRVACLVRGRLRRPRFSFLNLPCVLLPSV